MAETGEVSASFANLPDEICSLIFSYLNPIGDNLLQLALVCKRWRHIILYTPSLWKTFSSNTRTDAFLRRRKENPEPEPRVLAQKVTTIIRRFGKFISNLDISNIKGHQLKKAGVLKSLKELKVLSVFIQHTLPCDRRLLAALSVGARNSLREFTARGVMFRSDSGPISRIPDEVLLDLGDKFPFLRKLLLFDFHASYQTLTKLLERLARLQELEIVFTFEDEFNYRGVSGNYLRNYRLSEAGVIFQKLAVSPYAARVTRLSLDDVFLSGSHLKTMVENLKNLRQLDITAFGDENIAEKVAAEFHSDSLKEVVIWDVCYISELHLSIPAVVKLFLSDLNLEAVRIDSPGLEELHIASILLSSAEELNHFELQTGKLQKLDIMELGEHTTFSIKEFHNLLYSNPDLKTLEIDCIDIPKLEITEELCPTLNELSITGSADHYCITCAQLKTLNIKGDCIDPDLDNKQRCISVSCHELLSLEVHQLPNLVSVKLDCCKISSVSLCENHYGDDSLIPRHGSQISFGQDTVIESLTITNIKPERLDYSSKNKIFHLKLLSNSCLTDDELASLIASDLVVKNLTLLQCNRLKCLRLENMYLEDLIIINCDDLQKFSLNCPLLKHLRLKGNKSLAYTCHVYVRSDSLGAVLVSDHEYPSRVAFTLLNKVLEEFSSQVSAPQWRIAQPETIQFPKCAQYLQDYQNPKNADPMMKVQAELDETKVVLHGTIEAVLNRGEKLDDLVEKSEGLSLQSKAFYKTARKTNSCCCIQ